MDNYGKCHCPCHKFPGLYNTHPCTSCGHDNDHGEFIGGLTHGYWRKKLLPDTTVKPNDNANNQATQIQDMG